MATINYLIADDHKIFRQGVRLALSDDKQLKCVGEAGNGEELLQALQRRKADVVILDLKMPKMSGMEAIKEIRQTDKEIKIIILTMYDDENFILKVMEIGANGYLAKNAEPEEIKAAIYSVYENGHYFNDTISAAMLKSIAHKTKDTIRQQTTPLTDKEKEVLQLICKEHTNAEIAEIVFLSPRTIEGIRSSLLEKIGVRNIAGLVLYAVKYGLYEE